MSPRAAWRLESLGFSRVYDYVAGKADWFASGLAREGRDATIPRVGDVARRDVPTCRPTDRIGDVGETVRSTGWDMCIVVNDERVVLGRLRGQQFDAAPGTLVEQAMAAGPTTFRPDARLRDVVERMRARNVERVVVTTPDGRLAGVLDQDRAERRLVAAETPPPCGSLPSDG